MIKTSELVESLHEEAVYEKYEGIMLRKPESIYEPSKRSSNLLKFKDCCQDEYEVIGFKQQKVVNGSVTLGSVILRSYVDNKIIFSARPTMTNTEKKNMG